MNNETISMNFFIQKDNQKRVKKSIEDIKEELEALKSAEPQQVQVTTAPIEIPKGASIDIK